MYLRTVAPEFSPAQRAHLLAAADLYWQMAKEVLTGAECPLTIAPRPWDLPKGATWTNQMRQEELRRLRLAFELEKQAVAHLQAAAKGM